MARFLAVRPKKGSAASQNLKKDVALNWELEPILQYQVDGTEGFSTIQNSENIDSSLLPTVK